MRVFSDGVELGANEAEYQAALREYCDGLVINLRRKSKGLTIHKATCSTISFDLEAVGKKRRSPMIVFRDHGELGRWLDSKPELSRADLNGCYRCKSSP